MRGRVVGHQVIMQLGRDDGGWGEGKMRGGRKGC